MAESIIAYIPANSIESINVYQLYTDQYEFTWDRTGNLSSQRIYTFYLPSNTLSFRVRIPSFIVYGENTQDPSLPTWTKCACRINAEDDSSAEMIYFNNARQCVLPVYEYKGIPQNNDNPQVRIEISAIQDTNTGSYYFHTWASPVIITCESIYLDPQFPD